VTVEEGGTVGAGPASEAWRSRWPLPAALVAVLVKLWLVSAHDLMMTITPHDDLLFINQAAAILSGSWLGEYNQLTLIKGAFYPLFIALAYWVGIPLLAAQQLLQALASAVVVLALRPLIRWPWLGFLFFLVLLMHPFSYNYPAVGRVLQLSVYSSLGLLTLALGIGLALRAAAPSRRALSWALSLGLAAGVLWVTRDESIWILPSLILLLGWSCWRAVGQGWGRMRVALLLLLPLAGWAVAPGAVCTMNLLHYGVFVRNELETPEFKAAYGGLLRVRTPDDRRFYPVVRLARQQAYQVSPSLREIEPLLEGEIGHRWQSLCSQSDMSTETVRGATACPDLPAAFFIWAFRDAVTSAGHHRQAGETLAYYRRVGEEIEQACDDGRLDCRPRITSLIPPWRSEYTALVWPTFRQIFGQIVAQEPLSADTAGWLSRGDTRQAQLVGVVTGEPLLTTKRNIRRMIPSFHHQLNREKIRILEDIGKVYQSAAPALFLGAILAASALTAWDAWRRRPSSLVLSVWSILGGILAIAAILTLVRLTSYWSIGRAMHTAYPLVPFLVLVSLLELIRRFTRSEQS